MSRYTPPGTNHDAISRASRRPRWVRIGVWAMLVGALSLVLIDVAAVLFR